jgi:hypothetical protein
MKAALLGLRLVVIWAAALVALGLLARMAFLLLRIGWRVI